MCNDFTSTDSRYICWSNTITHKHIHTYTDRDKHTSSYLLFYKITPLLCLFFSLHLNHRIDQSIIPLLLTTEAFLVFKQRALKERKSAATTFSPPHKMIDTPLFPASSPSSCLAHFSPSSLICLTTISTTFCQCVSELLFQRQKEMSQEETKRGKHDRKGIACTL